MEKKWHVKVCSIIPRKYVRFKNVTVNEILDRETESRYNKLADAVYLSE